MVCTYLTGWDQTLPQGAWEIATLYKKKKISSFKGGQTLEQEHTEAVGSLEILKTVLDIALSNLIQQDLVW